MLRFLKKFYAGWNKDNIPEMAAALSFYTIFAIAPVFIIIIAIAGFFVGEEKIQAELIRQTLLFIGEKGTHIITSMMQSISKTSSNIFATIIGISVILLGATGIFSHIQNSLNTIFGDNKTATSAIKTFFISRFLSFLTLITIGLLFILLLFINTSLSVFESFLREIIPSLPSIVFGSDIIISFGITILLFAVIYRILPHVKMQWGEIWIGAFITSLLFNIGRIFIGWYLARETIASAYGAAGSIIVLLLWIYYSSLIFFIGAEFTKAYSKLQNEEVFKKKENRKINLKILPKKRSP